MIKLEGIINYINCKDKEAYKKFDEANRLFKELDNVYGQAVCNFSIGFLLYSKWNSFIEKQIDEATVFNKSKTRLEKSLLQYRSIQHYVGEGSCHQLLLKIKKKLEKAPGNHQQEHYRLMKKNKDLEKENKSLFILRNQGLEQSLIIEVVENQYQQVQEINDNHPKSVPPQMRP